MHPLVLSGLLVGLLILLAASGFGVSPALAGQGTDTGSVAGMLWTDVNANGLPDESPLVGVDLGRLHLMDGRGQSVMTTVSDREGFYRFDAVPPGLYSVTLEPVPSYWPHEPQSRPVEVQANSVVSDVNFALVPEVGWSDTPLSLFQSWSGAHQAVVAAGTTSRGAADMTIDLDVPGQVEQAYLLWTAHGWASTDSAWGRLLLLNGQLLEADWDFSSGWRLEGGVEWAFAYGADVTGLVAPGLQRYELSGLSPFLDHYGGAALIVRYSQPDLPVSSVQFSLGQDLMLALLGTYRGPNSAVTTWLVDPAAYPRSAILQFVWSELLPDQAMRIWIRSGEGEPPDTPLVGAADAWVLAENPLAGQTAGWEVWQQRLTIPAHHDYLQVQLESVEEEGNWARLEWLAAVLTVDDSAGLPGVSRFFAQQVPEGVLLRWETTDEADLSGFHVWSGPDEEDRRWRLTGQRITAKGNPGLYRFLDSQMAHKSRCYWLEVLRGDESLWVGPVMPVPPPHIPLPPAPASP